MKAFDPFQPQQLVQRRSNPAQRGITTGNVQNRGTRTYIQVETAPHERTYIESDDLEPVIVMTGGQGELLESLRFGRLGDLSKVLTYHKISSNLSNVFYAMQASRTDFFAYQFKPVYKFIESTNGRILITDEVGLGKTVEAGLIWLEARARTDARRLLVVCPSMLREKWKQELRFRFNVPAEVYDSRGFISLLEDFGREGDNFKCAAVCSLQSARQSSVQEALRKFENTPYRFDLVVIDEAHHLRNVDTQSHRVGALLSDLTEALVLLTATPIHLKNEDLFRLLSLLDADEFSNQSVFENRLAANEPVIRAQNSLRRVPADTRTASESVGSLARSPWFENSPLVPLALSRLDGLDPEDHVGLVEAGRIVENLNLFGTTISRTRKREVQEWRVLREPRVLKVVFNQQELDFYEAVTDAVRARVHTASGNSLAAFTLMMPQRQMASCIPAMVEYYRDSSWGRREADEDLLDEFGLESERDEGIAADAGLSPTLDALIAGWRGNLPDSKFDALRGALQEHFEDDPVSKVIIFSYFKRTLSYLQRRLAEAGIRSVVIHGDVPMEERQVLIEEFKTQPETQVLLSSEVGSEGIDLQFCRVMVNYDLPWNPMKVEQRIGRIDRLGQKAEVISVINFSVHGTIEEKILGRLYDRIGIFERSLGDLEPILGGEIQELTVDLLSQRLTPEQVESRIAQTQRAIETRRLQESELEDQSSVFFGSSDYILEQIGQARKLGRWITPEDLISFVTDFFASAYRGTRINRNRPRPGLITISLSNDARNELAHFCRMNPSESITALSRPGSESVVLAYSSEASQGHPQLEFLSHFHPLVRWIIHCHRQSTDPFFPTAAVEVKSGVVPPGEYLCAIEFWTFHATRKEVQIAYALAPLGDAAADQPISSDAAELLIRDILDQGKNWEHAEHTVSQEGVRAAWNACTDKLEAEREAAFDIFRQKTLAASQRRRTHLQNFLARKEETFRRAVSTLRERGAPASQIKAFQTQAVNLRESITDKIRLAERESTVSDEFKEVAGVVCRVRR